MRRKTIHPTRFIPACLPAVCTAVLLTMSSPVAWGQSIFADLPYSEQTLRAKIAQYSVSVNSHTHPGDIPAHVFYRLAFLDVMSDPALLADFPSADIEIILALPAHEDERFVHKDLDALTEVCQALDTQSGQVGEIAQAFDQSRQSREQRLDAHYERVLARLSAPTRQVIQTYRDSAHWQVSYGAYLMEALALDAPDIAEAILVSGCDVLREVEPQASLQTIALASQRAGQPMSVLTN